VVAAITGEMGIGLQTRCWPSTWRDTCRLCKLPQNRW